MVFIDETTKFLLSTYYLFVFTITAAATAPVINYNLNVAEFVYLSLFRIQR